MTDQVSDSPIQPGLTELLSQYRLSSEGGASGQVCEIPRRIELTTKIKFTVITASNSLIPLPSSPLPLGERKGIGIDNGHPDAGMRADVDIFHGMTIVKIFWLNRAKEQINGTLHKHRIQYTSERSYETSLLTIYLNQTPLIYLVQTPLVYLVQIQ